VSYEVPRIPASAGALIYDADGRLLILKPSYKSGWTIPGGQIEDGESPWDACRRETREECGLALASGRLVCVDYRTPGSKRPGGVRFVFDCGVFSAAELDGLSIDDPEIEDHRFAPLDEALLLLSGPLRRRVAESAGREHCVYLEDGRPLAAVS
jgi:8-oxo-dGTP pyrophosphatase MutT (NUDIX family)